MSKLEKNTLTQIQEPQRTSNRQEPKRKYPWLTIGKITSIHDKENALKISKKLQVKYKENLIRITADFFFQ